MDKVNDEIIKRVEMLPIEDVIGGEIELFGCGTERDAICPFHNDKHIGSFKVNTRKNIWKCFACNEGGSGGVTFYQKLHGLTYEEAAREVGLKFHVISNEEADMIVQGGSYNRVAAPIHHIRPAHQPNQKLEPELLDRIYRTFISVCPRMTDSFKQNLMENRFLDESDLSHFFRISLYSPCFMALLYCKMEQNGLSRELLKRTPGFYFDSKEKIFKFLNPGINALGIISHDEKGRINGIQIRRDTDDKKKRYIWFSSGFADGDQSSRYVYGTTNSHVVDVLLGEKPGVLACTEGKFKAIKLQKKMGYTTLNMHGVTSWPVEEVIRFAKEHQIKTVYLCYDADISQNDSVAKAALKFSRKLSLAGFYVKYLTWDIADGKGIDDMINTNPTSYLEKIKVRDAFDFNHSVLEPLIKAAS